MDTYIDEGSEIQKISEYLDITFNVIFTIEATLKIIAFGLFMDKNSYLTESWS